MRALDKKGFGGYEGVRFCSHSQAWKCSHPRIDHIAIGLEAIASRLEAIASMSKRISCQFYCQW